MSGRKLLAAFFLILMTSPLVARVPAPAQEEAAPGQHLVEWSEQHLLFVADDRSSRVQAFHLSAGAPVPCAQTRQNRHSRVRDMRLDAQNGTLWVLGYNGVSVYDARSLVLQRYIPLEGGSIAGMRIEDGRVVLIAGSGDPVGEIDARGGALG